jgi:hypothetical protein
MIRRLFANNWLMFRIQLAFITTTFILMIASHL